MGVGKVQQLGQRHPRIKELNAQIAEIGRQNRSDGERLARQMDNDAKVAGDRVALPQLKEVVTLIGSGKAGDGFEPPPGSLARRHVLKYLHAGDADIHSRRAQGAHRGAGATQTQSWGSKGHI